MNLFGEQHSKFVSGGTTVELPYTVLTPELYQSQLREFPSIINGVRTYSKDYNHAKFSIKYHLYQEADPNSKLTELQNYIHTKVIFYPHKDSAAWGGFFIANIEPYPLFRTGSIDICMITFVSTYTIQQGNYLLTQQGDTILTQEGEGIAF